MFRPKLWVALQVKHIDLKEQELVFVISVKGGFKRS